MLNYMVVVEPEMIYYFLANVEFAPNSSRGIDEHEMELDVLMADGMSILAPVVDQASFVAAN